MNGIVAATRKLVRIHGTSKRGIAEEMMSVGGMRGRNEIPDFLCVLNESVEPIHFLATLENLRRVDTTERRKKYDCANLITKAGRRRIFWQKSGTVDRQSSRAKP